MIGGGGAARGYAPMGLPGRELIGLQSLSLVEVVAHKRWAIIGLTLLPNWGELFYIRLTLLPNWAY